MKVQSKRKLITLRCPHCGKLKVGTKREPYDPDRATVLETLCPECIEETLAHEPSQTYFDSKGRPLLCK